MPSADIQAALDQITAFSKPYLPMASGAIFALRSGGAPGAPQTQANNALRCAPFFIASPITLASIGAEVTVIGDAASVVRLGIYNDNGHGVPTTLLLDAGTIPGDATNIATIPISLKLNSGWYWAASCVQGAPTVQPTLRMVGIQQLLPTGVGQAGNLASVSAGSILGQQGAVAGALPNPFAGSLTTSQAAQLVATAA